MPTPQPSEPENWKNGIPPFIRRRMPKASEEELLEATENVRRYIDIAIGTFEREARERLGESVGSEDAS